MRYSRVQNQVCCIRCVASGVLDHVNSGGSVPPRGNVAFFACRLHVAYICIMHYITYLSGRPLKLRSDMGLPGPCKEHGF